MAVNNDSTNKLYPVNDTSVKFFSSLTRNQAKGLDSFIYGGQQHTINDFPGAICYVSDNEGNSIFLNKLLFGDGANSGGSGGGSGEGGITEVSLDIIPVVELNGQVLKTLADYFSADGTIITEGLQIYTTVTPTSGDPYNQTIISLNSQGITINGKSVLTQDDYNTLHQEVLIAEQNAKDYTDSKLGSIYIVKGSINTLNELNNVSNPQIGWVYNVVQGVNTIGEANYIPPGTNFVYNGSSWDPLGGTIDLSNYKTGNAVTQEINQALQEAKNYTDQKDSEINNTLYAHTNAINALNTTYTSLTSQIGNNTNAISANTQNISQNTQNITNISTQLTWQ